MRAEGGCATDMISAMPVVTCQWMRSGCALILMAANRHKDSQKKMGEGG